MVNKIKHWLPALWLATITITIPLSAQAAEFTSSTPAPAATSFWSSVGSSIGSAFAWNSVSNLLTRTGKGIAKTAQIHPKATAAIGITASIALISCVFYYGCKYYYGKDTHGNQSKEAQEFNTDVLKSTNPRTAGAAKASGATQRPKPDVMVSDAQQARLHASLMRIIAEVSDTDGKDVLEPIKTLIISGVDVNAKAIDSDSDDTALISATKLGRLAIVEELLKTSKINVNAIDKYGMTALMHAASSGNIDVVKTLLDTNRCNVNMKIFDRGMPALQLAITRCEASHTTKKPCVPTECKYAQIAQLLSTAAKAQSMSGGARHDKSK